MSPANVLRSLEYLDQNIQPLVKATEGRGRLSRFLEDETYNAYWKFYNELTTFLTKFADETKNEEIKRLTQQYISNGNNLTECLEDKKVTGLVSLFFSNRSVSELEFFFKDRRDNITNLIYQVKLLQE